WLGDRVGARRLVGFGMLAAAGASFAFGLWSAGALFLVTAPGNGFAQSTGGPGNVKAMQEGTSVESRGRVMGVWATCYQVGGIAATAFAAWLLGHYGWRAAYFGPAAVLAAVAIAVFVFVRPGPSAPRPGEYAESAGAERRAVALSATVWWYGGSYFFIKLIRYSLLFWLPYYLETVLQYGAGEAGYFSTSFEIGGVCGTMALGALSDRLRGVPRSVLCAASLLGLAAAQDLGGRQAAALAIGMINGLGSVGAVSQEFITRGVSHAFGWNAVFYVLLVSAVAAAALLAPTFRTPPKRAEP